MRFKGMNILKALEKIQATVQLHEQMNMDIFVMM